MTQCNEIMAACGVQNVKNNTWATGAFCDGVFLMRAVFADAQPTDAVSFRTAVERLGSVIPVAHDVRSDAVCTRSV